MPADDPLRTWIASRLPVREIPPPPTTDYLAAGGENPRLTAFIASKLSTAAAPPRELTQAEYVDANPGANQPSTAEMAAWNQLDEEERAACLAGDESALQVWQELAASGG